MEANSPGWCTSRSTTSLIVYFVRKCCFLFIRRKIIDLQEIVLNLENAQFGGKLALFHPFITINPIFHSTYTVFAHLLFAICTVANAIRFLILGAAGLHGKEIILRALEKGLEVTGLDLQSGEDQYSKDPRSGRGNRSQGWKNMARSLDSPKTPSLFAQHKSIGAEG